MSRVLCIRPTRALNYRTSSEYGPEQFRVIRQRCGFEPGTWKSTRSVAHLKEFYFHLLRTIEFLRVSDLMVEPIQYNTAVIGEGIKLPFDQSYPVEVTTDPIGPHYITS
jgi:hypothetical protein